MNVVWLVAWIVLVILLVFFIFMYFTAITTLVNPSQCGASYGLYNVTPGATSTALTICGSSGSEVCSFSPFTLKEAVAICDNDSEKCSAFAFNELSRNMIYIDPAVPIVDANISNVYRRAVNPVRLN